jgi:hypothetical protein
MIIQRKTQIILALVVSSVFIFQNCATIIRGTSQRIPITSNPTGAKIIVDGEEMGYAPLNLKLKRKENHIIRIEKQGYYPLKIRIIPKPLPKGVTKLGSGLLGGTVGCVLGGSLAGLLLGETEDTEGVRTFWIGFPTITIGIILGVIVAKRIDSKSGANYALLFKELNVTLRKIGEKPQPNFIIIDVEQFQNIKWIRIKCADSGGKKL